MGLMIEFWEAAKSDSELASTKERTANAEKEAKNAGVLVEKIGTTNALLVSTNLWLAKEVLELAQQLKDTSKTAIETRDFVNETNTTARINEAHNIVTDAQKVAADISTIVASQDFKNLAQLKPKPLKERIRDCLNKISPTFLPEFDKRGDSWEWNGYFPQSRLEELEDLSKEPGGWKYIEIQRTGSGGMGTAGVTLEAKLHFFQFLLDKPN
jgi:hypothetical protein